jgi:transcriptional regulator GlxA family with amidase domain
MQIAILLFDRLTALDAVGPYEVLRGLPEADVRFVATAPGPQRTDHGALALVADYALDDVRAPDVIVVPGGPGEVAVRGDERALDWLRAAHVGSQWTTSVCTGSLVLAAAGLLDGKRATSHWTALDELERFGAVAVTERVVFDGKIVTAAGVSSGIDMALTLAARLAGEDVAQAIQLAIEYDPQPLFDAGSHLKASAELVEALRARSRFAN